MRRLAGDVVAITGASSGIGEALARRLAGTGARLVLAARRGDRLDRLRDELAASGTEVLVQATDVTDLGANRALIAASEERFGALHAFVANAGVMHLAPVNRADPAEWSRMVGANLLGLGYGVHAALPAMRRAGRGHVIAVGSVAGLKALPGCAMYCATKFGVRAFAESLRQEVGSDVRVTIVNPGAVATELPGHVTDEETLRGLDEAYRVALDPDAIAAAIQFALEQLVDVDVNELTVRPTAQAL